MDYVSVLPQDIDLSSSHQYLRIPHPRTGEAQLYLPYTTAAGQDVVLEAAKLNGSQRRTWFIGDSGIDAGAMLVHYPIDPLFIVIPLILALVPNGPPPPFQPLHDLLSAASTSTSFALPLPFTSGTKGKSPNRSEGVNEDIERLLTLKNVKRAFKACCEKKVISTAPPSPDPSSSPQPPTQSFYRPSQDLIIQHLKRKAGFFAGPEEFEKFDHLVRGLGRDGLLEKDIDEELLSSARLRAACDHLAQWLPGPVLSKLVKSYDFAALEEHLASRSAAAFAASQITTSNNKKEAKGIKRKAPPASRGVESLKKVNTNKMAKLTSFFKPKEKK
ncbi:hypothetical protein CNBH3810 [Cryptococcus deneoformans B-3501A]|uniref:Ribonuclease H2 subunit B n=1 Tax=Cryptococcus deneoformans (strain JEC21 / ATCC MYA-565) TaxID=214684 RepID=Q5KB28_CRYD1|nr:hypothetical protein CNI03990 [Cryptococcus neoformans var. neoformans JEC21]XP_773929.1 hypothetical protein CNBH3810 [Cryptococcus neoformans var. neoformans B-3501A]AAW45309.1 hypothetical protein CNI03990 [Cryptococcus neoformans var. neoformans JEC21]EAL19282.1 hypothetical protein CNBH3810 [Cryptococcus neoformans var. neoformans B-3501A]